MMMIPSLGRSTSAAFSASWNGTRHHRRWWLLGTLVLVQAGILPLAAMAQDAVIATGQTVTLESYPNQPTVQTVNGSYVIHGTLRGVERTAPGGTLTGNGGQLILNASNGFFIGSSGRIDVSATANGGNGGSITLNGPVISVDGQIFARGLGSGRGGTVTMNANSITLTPTARIYAQGGGVTANGGVIRLDAGTGTLAIQAGAGLYSGNGRADAASNIIQLMGRVVNVQGTVSASGMTTLDGGTVILTTQTPVSALGTDSIVVGENAVVEANGGTTRGSGGTVAVQASQVNIDGRVRAGGTGNGAGGVVLIDSGNTTLGAKGMVQAFGGTNRGNGGTIVIRATEAGTVRTAAGSLVQSSGTTLKAADGSYSNNRVVLTGGNLALGGVAEARGNNNTSEGGQVIATATTGDLLLSGTLDADGTRNTTGSGAGGQIIAQTLGENAALRVSGGRITAAGYQANNGGTILLSSADGDIRFDNGLVDARAYNGANTGNGGSITLNAAQGIEINALGTSPILNATAGLNATDTTGAGGQGGQITLNAGEALRLISTAPSSTFNGLIESNGANGDSLPGSGGRISLVGAEIRLVDLANTGTGVGRVFLRANGGDGVSRQGDGGQISLTATKQSIQLQGVQLYANAGRSHFNAADKPTGNGGSISLQARGDVNAQQTAVFAYGSGRDGQGGTVRLASEAGNILWGASSNLQVRGAGSQSLSVLAARDITNLGIMNAGTLAEAGRGGTVTVTAGGTFQNTGTVWAAGIGTQSSANGGTINISASNIDLLGSSSVWAYGGPSGGLGGRVSLTASNRFYLASGASVDSSGGFSTTDANSIRIQARSVAIDGWLNATAKHVDGVGGTIYVQGKDALAIGSTAKLDVGGSDLIGGGAGGTLQLQFTGQQQPVVISGLLRSAGLNNPADGRILVHANSNIIVTTTAQLLGGRTPSTGTIRLQAPSGTVQVSGITQGLLDIQQKKNPVPGNGNSGNSNPGNGKKNK
jgi:hypothetical protein